MRLPCLPAHAPRRVRGSGGPARPLAIFVRVDFATAGGAQRVALVGPLVLRRIAAGDPLDFAVEAGHGLLGIGVGDLRRRRLDMQVETRSVADAFAPGQQHRRAGAVGQSREQGHGQRLHAEERREFAVAGLRLLVGQDADRAALLEHFPQLPHGRALGAHLAHVVDPAHLLQERVADLGVRRPVDDRHRSARGQPLVEQFPVAVVRRGHDHAAARGQRLVVEGGAVHVAQQGEVAGGGLGPQLERFQRLSRGRAQDPAVQELALRLRQVRESQRQVDPCDPALTAIAASPECADPVAQPVQPRPWQAPEQAGGGDEQACFGVGGHGASLAAPAGKALAGPGPCACPVASRGLRGDR